MDKIGIELIIKSLDKLHDETREQAVLLAKIVTNQEFQKDRLDNIDKAIESIRDTDIKQTEDIAEHIRRTNILEDKIISLESKVVNPNDIGLQIEEKKILIEAKYNYKKLLLEKLVPIITALGALIVTLEKAGVIDIL